MFLRLDNNIKQPLVFHEGTIIFLLLLITTLTQMAIDIYLPSMPAMQVALMTTKANIQLTLSAYTVGFGFAPLLYGPLSDRYGRRSILIIGLIVAVISSIGCMLATNITSLIVFRLIQGMGAGAATVLARAILRDVFTGKRMVQVAGYMSIAWSMIPISAPVLGSYFQTYFGWRSNFIFLVLFCAFILTLTLLYLPDTNKDKRISTLHPLTVFKNYMQVFRHHPSMRFSVGLLITFASTISYATASPFLLQVDLGYSPIAFGWLSLLVSFSYLFGNILNNRCTKYFERMQLIRCGILMNVTATFAMLICAALGYFNVYTLIIPAWFMIFAGGFIFSNCLSSSMVPFGTIAGTAAAVIGSIQILGGSVASGIVSQLPFKNALPLSILLVIFSVILFTTVFSLSEPRHET